MCLALRTLFPVTPYASGFIDVPPDNQMISVSNDLWITCWKYDINLNDPLIIQGGREIYYTVLESFCVPLHCMCQHLHMTLFNLILSFHLSLIPLNRFHLGDVNFCLEQIQVPIRHTNCKQLLSDLSEIWRNSFDKIGTDWEIEKSSNLLDRPCWIVWYGIVAIAEILE